MWRLKIGQNNNDRITGDCGIIRRKRGRKMWQLKTDWGIIIHKQKKVLRQQKALTHSSQRRNLEELSEFLWVLSIPQSFPFSFYRTLVPQLAYFPVDASLTSHRAKWFWICYLCMFWVIFFKDLNMKEQELLCSKKRRVSTFQKHFLLVNQSIKCF